MTIPSGLLCTLGLLLLGVAPAAAQPAGDAGQPAPGTAPPTTEAPPRKTPPPRIAAPRARPALRARPAPPARRPAPAAATPRPAPLPRPAPVAALSPKCRPETPQAPKRTGLAVQLSVGTAAQVYASVSTRTVFPGLTAHFLLGYRVGRVTLGLGLEFVRTESKDVTGEVRDAHVVLFRPTLTVALWQPWPLSLYLSLGVHGGFLGTAGRNVVDDELPAVGFHGGLGVRYFFGPRFALGMEGGFQGVWLVDDDGDHTVDGTVMFYGAVVLLAIL